jgi:RHS repeat-associated protein
MSRSTTDRAPKPITPFAYNLRFPGQYYQAETGLNQNYNRDYDPLVGRYIESDIIGLEGGINTYTYVSDDPVRHGHAPEHHDENDRHGREPGEDVALKRGRTGEKGGRRLRERETR